MLAVRTLLSVESYAPNEPVVRHARILREIERSGPRLSDLERSFLQRLVAPDPRDRLTRGYEIMGDLQEILRLPRGRADSRDESRPLVVVINQNDCRNLVDRASELGFVPNPGKPHETFNPNDILHTSRFTDFVQKDLVRAQVYAVAGRDFYLLVGSSLILTITAYEQFDRGTNSVLSTWDFAYCPGVEELRRNDGDSACVDLRPESVVVRTKRQLSNRAISQNSRSWKWSLPSIDRGTQLRANLARLHEFIRCTNQIELLIRESEIFSYRVVDRSAHEGVQTLRIREAARRRPILRFCEVDGGMLGYLQREIDSRKRDCGLVVMTDLDDDGLTLSSTDKVNCWTVSRVDFQEGFVELERVEVGGHLAPARDEGVIRTWGMFGQIALIRRRKRAIDRLDKHSYLLRSLSTPGQVYMDTGPMPLPVPLSLEVVDEAKQAAIEDILRVRPIYALQGPPGTGKTTLVAHLLRQIFDDDPVAQVLITAQAHGAVDVLRAKVRDEAFLGVPEEEQPLAVRLGISTEGSGAGVGSVEDVSLQILQRAGERLRALPDRSALQDEWLAAVTRMETSLRTSEPGSTAPDFCEVVRRGANIAYCTTSAGDLEVLAEETQSFDWAIIEEAGKAHGFDLALPLQAGHRWLLIGDHKQLPPYRIEDYREGIDNLDDVADALEGLRERAGRLLDTEWVRGWRDRTPEQRLEFQDYARRWLKTFERIFKYCSRSTGVKKRTIDQADGAAAGMLSRQYRMHPTIGDLISGAYYDDKLVNQTLDDHGLPLDRVRHPYTHPTPIRDKAVIWLDTPWAARQGEWSELGPMVGKPRYTNPKEAETIASFIARLKSEQPVLLGAGHPELSIAVLSPYNQQVALIRNRAVRLPTGLVLKRSLRSRSRSDSPDARDRLAETVDSFQGNQADVIVVSLVRNNSFPPGEGLGFLAEAPRINVLLSRAERLLVIVGSWEFFEHQLVAIPLDDTELPLWHWKKVLVTLGEWFESGRAVRIAAESFVGDARP